MTKPMPRIATVAVIGPAVLGVTWRDGPSDRVDLSDRIDLAGWVGRGGAILAPLKDAAVFVTARLGDYGAAVEWGPEGGDLAIDAHHLRMIADEQRRFGREEAVAWQAEAGLSNREAADFLGVSLSTWNAYKAGSNVVPATVSMVCRAALRDPVLLSAHYRPRKPGRPRRADEPSAA